MTKFQWQLRTQIFTKFLYNLAKARIPINTHPHTKQYTTINNGVFFSPLYFLRTQTIPLHTQRLQIQWEAKYWLKILDNPTKLQKRKYPWRHTNKAIYSNNKKMGIFFFSISLFSFQLLFWGPNYSCTEKNWERERGYQHYQVVKSLRNWARAQERKAVRRGRLEGIMDGSDLTLEAASAAVITSSISNQKKKKKSTERNRERQRQRQNNYSWMKMWMWERKRCCFCKANSAKRENKLIEIGKERCRTPKGLLVEPRQIVRRQEGFQLETHKLSVIRQHISYYYFINQKKKKKTYLIITF